MSEPKIAVSLIARNAETTLRACIASLRPHVDWIGICLAGESTDQTPELARELADAVRTFDWCDDFAAARNAAWAMIPADCDWALWVDADDVVEGAEHLRRLAQVAPPHILGYWFPYIYARTAQGAPTTKFDRERFVRLSVGWEWKHRIHEVLTPKVDRREWLRTDDVVIVHQEHVTTASAERNLRLLLLDYEADPNDTRTLFYLGCQYFALADWQHAVEWWHRYFAQDSRNPFEQWWTYTFMAKAYRNLRAIREALEADQAALDLCPQFCEAYYGLAEDYLHAGEPEKALHWIALGNQMTDRPPPFQFINPLDLTFHWRLTKANALAALGRVREAHEELQRAYQVEPKPELVEAMQRIGVLVGIQEQAEGLLRYSTWMTPERRAEEWERIALPLKNVPEIQERFASAAHLVKTAKLGSDRRLVIFCGATLEDWAPPKLEETGIGGSETAVVKIAQLATQAGWRVDVYGQPGKWEGEHAGVGYWKWTRWRDTPVDVFVAWRNCTAGAIAPSARKRLLWVHDLHWGEAFTEAHAQTFDAICPVSAWHASHLKRVYPFVADKLVVLPNGVDLERFPTHLIGNRIQHRCVYTSSPDRGLEPLLQMWPRIRAICDDAELHIFYGWENIDKAIAQGHQPLAFLKERVTGLLKQPGVYWRGRLPQDELAVELVHASIWTYPSLFLETFCIGACEAMAAGLAVVSSRLGAIPEVVGDAGLLVPGAAFASQYQRVYTDVVRGLLVDPVERLKWQLEAQARANRWTWERAWKECWIPLLEPAVEAVA